MSAAGTSASRRYASALACVCMTQFSVTKIRFDTRTSSPMDPPPVDQSSVDQLSDPAAFADHLRPFVLDYPQPDGRSATGRPASEASFLLTLFSGKDGNGWTCRLRPSEGDPPEGSPSEGDPRPSAQTSPRSDRHWHLTVDTGRVVGVTFAANAKANANGRPGVFPMPPARSHEPHQ